MISNKIKILAVVDNLDNLTSIRALISDAFPEIEVFTAPSGRQGFDLAVAEDPDVILLDVIMPGMDGYEVCRKLKADKKLCGIPIVFITAMKSKKESRIKALECGAEAFLTKPIDVSELTAQIRAMLKIRSANIEKMNESEWLAKRVAERTRELEKENQIALHLLEDIRNENEARKKIQSDLFRSEAKYRQITENISDLVWTADLDMRTTYISPSVEKMLGESPEEHMRKTFEEKFTPDSLMLIRTVLSEESENEKDQNSDKNRTRIIEAEHYKADGNTVWISMHMSFLRDENGKVIGCQGVSRDITERIQAEQELHKSELRFRVAQEISPDGFTILHPVRNEAGEIIDFIFVYENQAIARINQTDPQKVIGKRLLDLFPAHRGTSIFNAYINVANTGHSQIVEDVNAGEVLSRQTWLRLVIVSMSEDIAILAQDITVRKKNEFEIRQSEERFQILFEKAPLGYLALDSEGCFVEVNQKWLDIFGYSKEEVIGKWLGGFLCPEYVDAFRLRFQLFKAQGYIQNEVEMLSKDGRRILIAFEGKIAYEADGKFKQMHGIMQDITDQRKAERALIDSEERFRLLVETSPDAVFIVTERRIGYANPAAIRLLKAESLAQLTGKLLMDWVHESYKYVVEERFRVLLEDRKPVPMMEQIYILHDGTEIPVEVTSSPIEYQNALCALVYVRDITERKKKEERRLAEILQFRNQQKLESIGTLASGVAHEINNPIMGIINYAQLIIDEHTDDSVAGFAREIIFEGNRISEIVNNLLFYSRQQKQAHSPADINDIIHRTLSLISGLLKKDRIEVNILTIENLPAVKCRSQHIQQILMNLLTNSRDALNEKYHEGNPDKKIVISTYLFEDHDRRWIRITIEDHGNGIPHEIQDKLFDPFFTTKPREAGTGLGLPISFGLARDHHGRLEFETIEGQYTKFHLVIPVDNGWDIEEGE